MSCTTEQKVQIKNFGIYDAHLSGLPVEEKPPILILLSGFPDTIHTWSKLIPNFQKSHHVVAVTLPEFNNCKLQNQYWGYTFTQMSNDLQGIIKHYKDSCECETIHLVGHDWGAFIVLLAASVMNKQIAKLVLLDIGVMLPKEMGLYTAFVVNAYILFLAFCFILSRFLWDRLVIGIACLYPWILIGPLYMEELPCGKFYNIKTFMFYPYYQFIFNQEKKLVNLNTIAKIPTLFMYGTKKRAMYHTRSFLKELEQNPESCWIAMKNCGHWFHWAKPVETASFMKDFLLDLKR